MILSFFWKGSQSKTCIKKLSFVMVASYEGFEKVIFCNVCVAAALQDNLWKSDFFNVSTIWKNLIFLVMARKSKKLNFCNSFFAKSQILTKIKFPARTSNLHVHTRSYVLLLVPPPFRTKNYQRIALPVHHVNLNQQNFEKPQQNVPCLLIANFSQSIGLGWMLRESAL